MPKKGEQIHKTHRCTQKLQNAIFNGAQTGVYTLLIPKSTFRLRFMVRGYEGWGYKMVVRQVAGHERHVPRDKRQEDNMWETQSDKEMTKTNETLKPLGPGGTHG